MSFNREDVKRLRELTGASVHNAVAALAIEDTVEEAQVLLASPSTWAPLPLLARIHALEKKVAELEAQVSVLNGHK